MNRMSDVISRQAAIDKINERQRKLIYCFGFENDMVKIMDIAKSIITIMPSAQPDASKYEYHYDHTDCIWYGDGSNKCPSTCSQYRDGWNDAMQYIFCNGKGYRPYRRDGHHE